MLENVYSAEIDDTTLIKESEEMVEQIADLKNLIPTETGLLQNYPNPFNPNTTISYQLPGVGTRFIVSLKVYDMLGREVVTLVDDIKEPGYYSIQFDGSKFSSGVYFTRLTVEPQEGKPFVQMKKMMLLK
jgi:hypothetical protein